MKVLPQQQAKDHHISETYPAVLGFVEFTLISLSTQQHQYLKDDPWNFQLHCWSAYHRGQTCLTVPVDEHFNYI